MKFASFEVCLHLLLAEYIYFVVSRLGLDKAGIVCYGISIKRGEHKVLIFDPSDSLLMEAVACLFTKKENIRRSEMIILWIRNRGKEKEDELPQEVSLIDREGRVIPQNQQEKLLIRYHLPYRSRQNLLEGKHNN